MHRISFSLVEFYNLPNYFEWISQIPINPTSGNGLEALVPIQDNGSVLRAIHIF